MKYRLIYMFLIAVFLLAACSQASQVTGDASVVEATEQVGEGKTDQKAGTQDDVEGQSGSNEKESQKLEALSPYDSEASRVSSEGCREKEPIAVAYEVLSPPSDSDRISGPDDALVTIIEYGDFQ